MSLSHANTAVFSASHSSVTELQNSFLYLYSHFNYFLVFLPFLCVYIYVCSIPNILDPGLTERNNTRSSSSSPLLGIFSPIKTGKETFTLIESISKSSSPSYLRYPSVWIIYFPATGIQGTTKWVFYCSCLDLSRMPVCGGRCVLSSCLEMAFSETSCLASY